ncbi:MAG TPA: transglutaminase domain-containing protein [Bacteroidota bacterium]|nr:transglutaminase domain-containing protein [Bacteroidota bacterium]
MNALITLSRGMLVLLVLTGGCLLATAAPPQDPPMEWGSISSKDLTMNSYLPDSNAHAVILCDYGETTLDNDFGLKCKCAFRIKILDKGGFGQADQYVTIYSRNHIEVLTGLEGTTYNLDAKGDVVRTEMEDNAVFKEEVDESRTRFRFTLPAVQPGSVIEYRYTIKARPFYWGMIRDWHFQERIPVLWSEYRVMIPHTMAYRAVTNKRFPFTVDEMTEKSHLYSGHAAEFLGHEMTQCYQYRWVIRDAPAIPDEPYVSRLEDYAQKVDLELAEYIRMDVAGTESLSMTWEDIIKGLLKDEEFGRLIDASSSIRTLSDQLAAGHSTQLEKMKSIYDYVRNTVVWTGHTGLYSPRGPDQVLETKKGSAAQIAFLLISMLRSAGIDTDPIILSTRSNGMIQTKFPAVNQFNYVIAKSTIGGTDYLLDATDPLRPYDILPGDIQKVGGLVIKDGPAQWIVVKSPRQFAHRSRADVQIKPSGAIAGTLESWDDEYSALEKRKSAHGKTLLEFAKRVFDVDHSGINIDSVTIAGEDSTERPIVLTARVTSDSYAQVGGNLMYINPAIIDRPDTSRFKSAERKIPVNMLYGEHSVCTTNITLPEGYEIREVPKDQTIRVGSNDAVFSRVVQVVRPSVQFKTELTVNRTDYQPDSYRELKEFFERIVAIESEQMVLAHSEPSATKAAPGTKKKAK